MTNNKVPPRSAPTAAEAKEMERRLFEGLAGVKMFPMDPSEPGQPPGRMLPVSSLIRKEATQPALQPEFVGPIEQAMRAHPGLTRIEAEEMAEAFGFSTAPAYDEQPPLLEKMTEEHLARMRAAGHKVTVMEPPEGPQPLVATFHRAKKKPTKGEN